VAGALQFVQPEKLFFLPLNVLLITNGVSAVLLNRASVNWFGGVELQHFTETMFSLDFQFSIV
jgi:hypothetical protein